MTDRPSTPDHLRRVLLLLTMAPLVVAMDEAPRRRALVVGISKYPEEARWVPLPGARVDAMSFATLLQDRFGFVAGDIRLLLDEEATHQNITEGFREWLVQDSGPDTLTVFYFAGHGSRVFDEEEVESDYRDETLVPYDTLGHDQPRKDLRDDELRQLFHDLAQRTPHAVGIFDCCHSGTATRNVAARYVARRVPEYVPEDAPLPPVLPPDPRRAEHVVDLATARYQATILSACLDDQSALEDTQRGRGVFSWMLEQALRNASPGATWLDMVDLVRSQMRELGLDQEPVIHGNATAAVFDQAFERREWTFPTLTYHLRRGITVRGGQLQGLQPGTQVRLVPNEEQEGAEPVPARVESAGLGECTVQPLREVTREEGMAMDSGRYHAEVLERATAEFSLPVHAAEDEVCRQVYAAILDTPFFHAAGSAEEAALTLTQGTEDVEVFLDTGVRLLPHPLRQVAEVPSAWRNDPRLIADDLRAYAVWRSVRSLVNASSALREDVTLEVVPAWLDPSRELHPEDSLFTKGARGEWLLALSDQEARQAEQGGGIATLECTLTSRHDQPLYLMALNLLPDWSVVVLNLDQSLDPDGPGAPVSLEMATAGWVDGCAPEQVVFFLSEEQESLAWLESAGLRRPADLGLEPLLGSATRGLGGGRVSSLLKAALSQGGLRGTSGSSELRPWTTLCVDYSILPVEAGSLRPARQP